MEHVKTFESFIFEANVAAKKNSRTGETGWMTEGGEFNYSAEISFSGGKAPVTIQPIIQVGKGKLGSEVRIYDTAQATMGRPPKYADIKSMFDLISGVNDLIKMIPTYWKDWEKLPEDRKSLLFPDSRDAVNVDTLQPAKLVKVEIYAEPKNAETIEEDQKAINEEIKKLFPRATGIGEKPTYIRAAGQVWIVFSLGI